MSLTVTLGIMIENERLAHRYLFASLMFCLASLQLLNGLLVAGQLSAYPALIFWYLPFLALIGPLFFLTFKSANCDSYSFKMTDYLHFSCGLLIIPLLIPLSALDSETKAAYIMKTPRYAGEEPMFRLYSALFLLVILNLAGYLLYFIRECLYLLNLRLIMEKKVSPYLMIIIIISFPLQLIFFGGLVAISMVEHSRPVFFGVVQALTALSFFLTLFAFVMEKKNINFFKVLHTQIETRRYEISMTHNLDVTLVLSRIKSLFEHEKIFCDEDLSLSSLARELEIEPYQLSRIVNENFNKNFKNFINEYRIEEAKKILLSEKDRTITSVAYAVGFNSTTVFYEWFSRITGITPKKFREKTCIPEVYRPEF